MSTYDLSIWIPKTWYRSSRGCVQFHLQWLLALLRWRQRRWCRGQPRWASGTWGSIKMQWDASKDSRQLGEAVLSLGIILRFYIMLISPFWTLLWRPIHRVPSHPERQHLALSSQVDGALNGKLASKEEVIRAQGETRVWGQNLRSVQRNLKCVKAEHNLLRGAFLSSKLCSFAVKDGRGDTREKAEQRRTRCLILEQDSNLRRFSGLSCQKAIKRQFPLTILAQVLKGRRVF